MKKLLSLALCVVMSLSLIACNSKPAEKNDNDKDKNDQTTEMANPFITVNTLEEATKKAGFNITLPDNIPEGYTIDEIRVLAEGGMIEVVYTNGESEIIIRKAKGSEDISGDFNKYPEVSEKNIDDITVDFSGTDGKVQLATWTDGDYSYSISSYKQTDDITPTGGLTDSEMTSLVENIA